eukprot:4028886-Pleurochrysis_carterae.AAC.3
MLSCLWTPTPRPYRALAAPSPPLCRFQTSPLLSLSPPRVDDKTPLPLPPPPSLRQVVASAIVDKYIGESARLIREMFGYAKDHQPCIIFMDEIDAIGGRRFSEGTSADREIQRTLMELLNQLDGFDALGKARAACEFVRWG